MKLWQAVLVVLVGSLVAYWLLRVVVGTLFLLLLIAGVVTVLGLLAAAWLRHSRLGALPCSVQTRRIERKANRALKDLKKSDRNEPR
ncbi:MAG: hypothetical protein K0Q72_1171 [Armatimonadetes bacterium]|jgi:hypothetical protein|nr:hypothetical protein [Armatimonadota bacterium]